MLLVLGAVSVSTASETSSVAQHWASPGEVLEERVTSTRTRALELGLRNVEPAARSLLYQPQPEGPSAAARAAVRLAPDLPAAHMALALARWAEFDVLGGLESAIEAIAAIERNLEASLWMRADGFWILALTLIGGAAGFLLLGAVRGLSHAAHDLGDRLLPGAPGFSRAALLGALMLLPCALGEGPLGLALGAIGINIVYGGRRQRIVTVVAVLALAAGIHPVLFQAGRSLAALHGDPVAVAVHAAEHGLASEMELARLEQASARDPLASRALALGIKRRGDLAEANRRYAQLLAAQPDDPVIANNAANVRLALGDNEGAIALYRGALRRRESAVILFNLSQAWGVALRVDQLDQALERAQELDPSIVAELSEIQGRATHFVADILVPTAMLRNRLLQAGDGAVVARDLRRPLAPGWMGASWPNAALALGAALALALALSRRFQRSRSCGQCGARICSRCDAKVRNSDLCEMCTQLFHHPERADASLRSERLASLRDRRERLDKLRLALAVVVPGLSSLISGRPGAALAACLLAGAAFTALGLQVGIAADPLAAGATGPFLVRGLGVVAAVGYAMLTMLGLVAFRRSG